MTYYKFVYDGATRKSFVHMDADKEKIREVIKVWEHVEIDLNDIEIISEEEYKEIRPCPVCEGVAELYSDIDSEGKNIYCYACSICGEGPFGYYCTEEEAITGWNAWVDIG